MKGLKRYEFDTGRYGVEEREDGDFYRVEDADAFWTKERDDYETTIARLEEKLREAEARARDLEQWAIKRHGLTPPGHTP